MDISTTTRGRRTPHAVGRRGWRLALGAAILATAAVLSHASSASAFVVSESIGQPGKVSIAGFCTDTSQTCPMIEATGEQHGKVSLAVAPVTVSATWGEGIGAGEQKVSVRYLLQRRDGGVWTTLTSTPNNFLWLYPGQQTQLPAWSTPTPDTGSTRQEYRIEVSVAWSDDATSIPLGEEHLDPTVWGDAGCAVNTDTVPCTPTRTGGLSL